MSDTTSKQQFRLRLSQGEDGRTILFIRDGGRDSEDAPRTSTNGTYVYYGHEGTETAMYHDNPTLGDDPEDPLFARQRARTFDGDTVDVEEVVVGTVNRVGRESVSPLAAERGKTILRRQRKLGANALHFR